MHKQVAGVVGVDGDSVVEHVVVVLASELEDVITQSLHTVESHAGVRVRSSNCVTFTGKAKSYVYRTHKHLKMHQWGRF